MLGDDACARAAAGARGTGGGTGVVRVWQARRAGGRMHTLRSGGEGLVGVLFVANLVFTKYHGGPGRFWISDF